MSGIDMTDPARFMEVVKCSKLRGSQGCRLTYPSGETETIGRAYFVTTLERLGHHQAKEVRSRLLGPQARPSVRCS